MNRMELITRGPVFPVAITIERNVGKALEGKQRFAEKRGFALLDTGCSKTSIDERVAQELGLPPVSYGSYRGSGNRDAVDCSCYPVQFTFGQLTEPGQPVAGLLIAQCQEVIGAQIGTDEYVAIIGRDILSLCSLSYDGTTGEVVLQTAQGKYI